MAYQIFKFLHIIGVVLLLGNVTVTSVWKVFADRSGSATTVAFAQRLVTGTDWTFTVIGIALIAIGGYGMCVVADLSPLGPGWLVWSQILFLCSGIVWACVLLPIQVSQARFARSFTPGMPIPEAYKRLSRHWLVWGVVATVPLVAAVFVMTAKT